MAKSVYYIIEANSGEYYEKSYYNNSQTVLGISYAQKFYTKPLAKEKLRVLKELYPDSFDKGKIKKVVIRY